MLPVLGASKSTLYIAKSEERSYHGGDITKDHDLSRELYATLKMIESLPRSLLDFSAPTVLSRFLFGRLRTAPGPVKDRLWRSVWADGEPTQVASNVMVNHTSMPALSLSEPVD